MTSAEPRHGFRITLDNFEGPFDLLLQLIGRHQLDITEVALSQVTDEFIAYVKAGGEVWDLEQTSSFLVVAATLLDLKAARLLPSGDVDDPSTVFTSYLLSNGCLWTSVQQAFTEYAAPNPAIPSIDVTQTEHRVIGVGGLSCAAGMPVNPSNSDLATAANWALTISPMTTSSRKGIGVVAIKTNATVPA